VNERAGKGIGRVTAARCIRQATGEVVASYVEAPRWLQTLCGDQVPEWMKEGK
jgi:hypothetical protein